MSAMATARQPPMGALYGLLPRRSERNFLLENKRLMTRYRQPEPARRLVTARPLLGHGYGYALPTAASLARQVTALPLAETQRRLISVRHRWGAAALPVRCSLSEKQIQTEDISDEQFLNAALRKCTQNSRSEGDPTEEPQAASNGPAAAASNHLRRTASSFELGRMPAQRSGYQPGQYTLQRPVAGVAGIVPGALDHASYAALAPVHTATEPCADDDDAASTGSSHSAASWHVQQMCIPEIVDVEPEPQLDQPLSARSQVSKRSAQMQTEPTLPAVTPSPGVRGPSGAGNQQLTGNEPTLLTEEQRLELIEGARARQRLLIAEYNRLPITMGTLRVRNLKIRLEQQLDLVDSDLSVLSKSHLVYWQQPVQRQAKQISQYF